LPEKEELKLFLKDILEEEVDKKYYLSEKAIERILERGQGKIDELISKTITAQNNYKGGRQANIIQVNNPKHSNDRVYSPKGISPTLNIMQGGHRQPFIIRDAKTLKENKTGICHTLRAEQGSGNRVLINNIRKLTPTECFRLMGFLDDEINLEGLSDTQKYKLAGNGWDINIVSKIFKQMFN